MKIFWTKAGLENYVAADRFRFMDVTARKAAGRAIESYLGWRTLDWWREQIDEAEKADEKYARLADLIVELEKVD
jgi:hypothetical protein